MNSFISHRLYATAVTSGHGSAPKTARNETAVTKTGIASAIPLELLEPDKAPASNAARRLRATPAPVRS